jgi:hypothetical protein
MKTVMQGLVRSATFALTLASLFLAASAVYAADLPSHSSLFRPWINGVAADEAQKQVQH